MNSDPYEFQVDPGCRGVDPGGRGGGGGSRPSNENIGGGATYRFAPSPNNFDNLKNSYVMQE